MVCQALQLCSISLLVMLQQLYIIYQNGQLMNLDWGKNSTFILRQNLKLVPRDQCGHFSFHDGTNLNIFFGSSYNDPIFHDGRYNLIRNWTEAVHMPWSFNIDASVVQVMKYLWVVGGSKTCSKGLLTAKGSVNSYLWSISKNVWLTGPNVSHTNYEFINACALAMNATTVLFIGLSNSTSYGNRSTIPNDLTATYNFEVGAKSRLKMYFVHEK